MLRAGNWKFGGHNVEDREDDEVQRLKTIRGASWERRQTERVLNCDKLNSLGSAETIS